MMIRATRTRRPSRLALVAGGVMVMGSSWTLAGRAGAVDVVGGRVQFAPSQRVIDTREGTGGTLGPVTELPVSGGLVNVTITQPAGPGRALVHPCATPDDPARATFLFDTGQTMSSYIAASEPMCLTSTVALDVVVDSHGTVFGTAGPGPLQYVELPAPVVVYDGALAAGDTPLELGAGVPGDAGGVVFDVRAFGPVGFVTFHPCGIPRALASDLTVVSLLSETVVSTVLGTAGDHTDCLFSQRPAAVQVVVLGYLRPTGPDPSSIPPTFGYRFGDVAPPGLVPFTPTRVLDTREGLGAPPAKVSPGGVVTIDLSDQIGPGTTAVILNVTATETEAAGFVTAYPCDAAMPTASNLNYERAQTVPNLVTVPVSADGTVCLLTKAAAHLVADLTGTIDDGGDALTPVTPYRLLDTRDGAGTATAGPIRAGEVLTLEVTGRGGIPAAGVTAVTLNVTATEAVNDGFLTAFPCDAPMPTASNVNYRAGQTVPNAVTVALAANGTVCLYAHATVHVVVDAAAWFGPTGATGYEALTPTRALDTRVSIGQAPYGVGTIAKVSAGDHATVYFHDRFGVPSDATAVVLNVTVTDPGATGFVTVYPCDQPRPTASNLNYERNQTVANQVTVALTKNQAISAPGNVCLFTQQTTNLVVDVAGYYTTTPEQGWSGTLT